MYGFFNQAIRRNVAGRLPRLIWLVWLAIFLDTLLYTGVLPLLDEIGQTENLSDGLLGLILAAYSFSGVFACLPFGLASDRWKPGPILIGSVIGISTGGLLVAAFPSPVGIAMGRMVQGLASSALWTAGMAVVSQQAGPERRGQAVARIFSAASAGELVGPVLSGFLFERVGISPFFWLAAVIGAGVTVGLAPRQGHSSDSTQVGERDDRRKANGWVPLIASGALSLLLVSVFASMLLFTPLMLARRLDFSPVEIGLAFVGWNGVMLLSQMVVGRWADRAGWRRPLLVGLVGVVGGLVGLAGVEAVGLTLGMLVLVSLGTGFASTVVTSHFSGAWEARRPAGTGLGTAFGVSNTIWSFGFLIGNAAGGGLLTIFEMEAILLGMAVLLIPFLVGVFSFILRREIVKVAA